jgi:hypothetical protein
MHQPPIALHTVNLPISPSEVHVGETDPHQRAIGPVEPQAKQESRRPQDAQRYAFAASTGPRDANAQAPPLRDADIDFGSELESSFFERADFCPPISAEDAVEATTIILPFIPTEEAIDYADRVRARFFDDTVRRPRSAPLLRPIFGVSALSRQQIIAMLTNELLDDVLLDIVAETCAAADDMLTAIIEQEVDALVACTTTDDATAVPASK